MTSVGVATWSGTVSGDDVESLRAALAQHGVDDIRWVEFDKTDSAPDAVAELVQAGVEVLFAWGGDGTVQRSLDAVGSAPIRLAILPAGTANLFAKNLGIPPELQKAVKIGVSGRTRTLDVGVVNGERFGVMAGTGFDAVMIRNADAGLKDRLGRFAYVVAGVRGIGRDPVRTRVELDGTAWFEGPATCVLVGNMGDVFGGISVFPDARPDDGLLNVGIVTADGVADWARLLGRTVVGHPGISPFVETTTAARVIVHLEKGLPYELDGDARPTVKHLDFSVQPGAVTVGVPGTERES